MEKPVKLPLYIKGACILLGIALALYILYIAQGIIAPLVFALFIAILVNPLVNFLTRWRLNRVVAIFLSVFLVVIFALALAGFMSAQVAMFSETSGQFGEKFNEVSKNFISWFSQTFHVDISSIHKWMKDTENSALKSAPSSIAPALLSLGSTIIEFVLIPVYIFLILYYKVLLLEFIGMLFNTGQHKMVIEILENINSIVRKYLTGLLVEGLIVAVLNSVALLALGVEYAILLGITGAVLNVIPYIGGIVAVAIPMLVAFVTKSPLVALLVLIFYLIIQFIDNHYLIPYIVASRVKLNALVAIVVVLVGNLLWGVAGMFLSIPVTALIKLICDHIEPLKPYGFLLGDSIPVNPRLILYKNKT